MSLLVGLEIPSPVRPATEERAERLGRSLPRVGRVASADPYPPLAFLGDRQESFPGTLGASLSVAFASHEGFEVQLAGAGESPKKGLY